MSIPSPRSSSVKSFDFLPDLEPKKSTQNFDPLNFLPSKEKLPVSHYVLHKGIHPLTFEGEGNIIRFAQPALFELAQDIHVKVLEEGIFFSLDGREWKHFEELFAYTTNYDFSVGIEDSSIADLGVRYILNLLPTKISTDNETKPEQKMGAA